MGATLPALARQVEASSHGSDSSTARTSPERCSDACSRASICCACTTWPRRPTWRWRSTWPLPRSHFVLAAVTPALDSSPARDGGGSSPAVYIAIALSGLCALGAEAIWTRITRTALRRLGLHAFHHPRGLSRRPRDRQRHRVVALPNLARPRFALGWCQLLAGRRDRLDRVQLSASLPYWPINPSISSNIWFNFQLDLARALWALLPPTLLWGASFPLALAAAASKGQDSSRLFAGIYAANTLGAIVGALGASLLLVAWVGSQRAEQVLIVLSMIAGLILLPRRSVRCDAHRRACGIVLRPLDSTPSRPFRNCSSRTAATPRPGSARATSSTQAKASTRRWRSRVSRTAP